LSCAAKHARLIYKENKADVSENKADVFGDNTADVLQDDKRLFPARPIK
jgi:hypothetical protein